MTIITVSRGSYSKGKEVAEKVAEKLGYECVGREELLEGLEEYGIPEAEVVGAAQYSTSVLDHFPGGREGYIAHIQASLTSRVRKDNVVYHGMAGQFLLRGVSHVLNMRITAPLDYRIGVVMDRDKVPGEKAIRSLKQDDEERYRWTRKLFLIDPRDCTLYDLVLGIDKCSVEDAVNTICYVAGFKGFQRTPESQKAMDDLQLACAVRRRLVGMRPGVEVSADNGIVTVKIDAYGDQEKNAAGEVKAAAAAVPGVDAVQVIVLSPPLGDGSG